MLTMSLALLVLFVGYADLRSTELVLQAGGRELNPVMRWVQGKTGRRWVRVKMLTHVAIAGAVIAMDAPATNWIVIIAVCLNTWVAMNNFRAARRSKI